MFWRRVTSRISPREIYLSQRARNAARDIIAGIDQEAFFAIRKNARSKVKGSIDLKYFNLDDWVPDAVLRAMRLGLHNERRKAVLDIGTGFGLFPYACEYLSHEAWCTDIPDHQLYNEVTDVLGLNKIRGYVQPMEKLPDFPTTFDYITAFQIAFDRPNEPTEWGPEEWRFFLDDVTGRLLNPGGRLHLGLNYKPRLGAWCSPEVRKVFEEFGGKVDHDRVDLVKAA